MTGRGAAGQAQTQVTRARRANAEEEAELLREQLQRNGPKAVPDWRSMTDEQQAIYFDRVAAARGLKFKADK
jgi:hypothetical protein